MKVTPFEVGVLRKEAVTRMHGIGAAALDHAEDRLGVEIGLGCRRPAERVSLVGEAHVHGVAIEVGVHGDGWDAEFAARPDDAHGDLPAVGDQNLGEHRSRSIAE